MPDITDLLEATTPVDLPPIDVGSLGPRAKRQRRRRTLAIAGTTALVLAVGAGVALDREPHHDEVVANSPEQNLDPWLASVGPDADVAIFLRRDLTETRRRELEQELSSDPRVASYEYYGEKESMQELERLFAGNPAMLDEARKNPDLVPTSFRLKLRDVSPAEVDALTRHFATQPAVLKAVSFANP